MLQGRNVIGTWDLTVRDDYVLYLHFSEDSWPEMKFCYPVNCLRDQAEDSLEVERQNRNVSALSKS